jgi:UDP-glucose 4-epimerase
VTGAGGFVGANLVRRLVRDGLRTIAIVRPGGDPWRLDDSGAELLEVDVEDPAAVRAAVLDLRPRWIFNLAAHGAYSWQTDLERMVRVNVLAVAALREAAAAANTERLVHAGSSSEYGPKDHAPDESEAIMPASDYAATKAAATQLLAQATRDGRPETVVLRLYSVYGPWEEPGRFVPALVAHSLQGLLPPLVDPAVARDFVFVDDVVDAFLRAASGSVPPGAVFNVCSGKQSTIGDVVEAARQTFHLEVEPTWGSMPRRAWDSEVWVGRPDRIEQTLGWMASVSVEEGLERTRAWMEDAALAARYLPTPARSGAG